MHCMLAMYMNTSMWVEVVATHSYCSRDTSKLLSLEGSNHPLVKRAMEHLECLLSFLVLNCQFVMGLQSTTARMTWLPRCITEIPYFNQSM